MLCSVSDIEPILGTKLTEGTVEPGGYLQWDEEDSLSKMPVSASKTDAAQAQLRWYIRNRLWPNTE